MASSQRLIFSNFQSANETRLQVQEEKFRHGFSEKASKLLNEPEAKSQKFHNKIQKKKSNSKATITANLASIDLNLFDSADTKPEPSKSNEVLNIFRDFENKNRLETETFYEDGSYDDNSQNEFLILSRQILNDSHRLNWTDQKFEKNLNRNHSPENQTCKITNFLCSFCFFG